MSSVNKVVDSLHSGGPGTTGREVFEDSTATGPGAAFRAPGTAGATSASHTGSGPNTEQGQSGNTGMLGGSGSGIGSGTGGTGVGGVAGTGSGVGAGAGTGPGSGVGQTGHATGTSHNRTASGNYGSVAPVSAAAHSGHSGHEHGEHQNLHHGQGHGNAGRGALGAGGVAAGAANAATGLGHGHSHGTHATTGHNQGVDPGTSGLSAGNAVGHAAPHTTDEGFGGAHKDKVGGLGQGQQKYEGNPVGGPVSSGAAGTDRFDTSKGVTGTGGNAARVSGGTTAGGDAFDQVHDTSQKAPGKSSGGLSGLLATSDKDFTGRDRLGSGAYADTHGIFQGNKTGPGGNTALTGREGTIENNPVAQAKSRSSVGSGSGSGAGTEAGEKKGFVQKVKDALS